MKRIVITLTLAGLLMCASRAVAHPGHEHASDLRIWKDAKSLLEIQASFVLAQDGRVQLCNQDGSLAWVPIDKLSAADRVWVQQRLESIRMLNGEGNEAVHPSPVVQSVSRTDSPGPFPAVMALGLLCFLATGGASLLSRKTTGVIALLVAGAVAVGAPGDEKPAIQAHFEPFQDKIKFRSDADYFYIESNGMPDHRMMVGITAWQQQVPIPQAYTGRNAWQIPLRPKLADRPVSAKTALFRGAIALAVNGVPIFNPIKNDGRTDTFLAGELDEFGGHCGRADDYHYHISPIHLEKVVGKGNPIGYALDGYPLYGYFDGDGREPKNLDEFNGRTEKDSYRYYSTKKYPYVNGGLRGVVTVRDDQIDPQPRASSPRPALLPLRGAKITGFERDDAKKTATVTYDLNGRSNSVKYTRNDDSSYAFVFTDAADKQTTETYRGRPGGKDDPPPKKKDGPPKKDNPPPKKDGDEPPKKDPPPKKDGDGPRLPWLAAHFDELDADGDGFLTVDELKKEVNRVFAAFDVNKNGKLSKDEYDANAPDVKSPLAAFVKDHAAEFADKDGVITKQAFEAFITAMLEKADRKKAGKITKADAAQGEQPKKGEPPPKKDDEQPSKQDAPPPKPKGGFSLSSPAFEHNGKMPAEYTGDGDGVSPPLKWTGAPAGTRFYALQLWHKPKADGDEVKSYWVVTNIPADVTGLEKNSKGVGKDGYNDKRRTGYDPMNSKGPGPKEYHITLYALSAEPKYETDKVTRTDLLKAVKDITLAETTLSYTYERKPK